MLTPDKFVFLDPSGKRWSRLRWILFATACAFFVASVLFVQTLLITPEMRLPASVRQMKSELKSLNKPSPAPLLQTTLLNKYKRTKPRSQALHPRRPERDDIRLAYVAEWDEYSLKSLRQNATSLTHVAPEWFSMRYDGKLQAHPEEAVRRIADEKGLAIIPQLTNLGERGWHPEAVEILANATPERQLLFVAQLLFKLDRTRAQGVLIDWQQIDPIYKDQYTQLLSRMAEAFHREKKEIWLSIPVGQEFAAFDMNRLPEFVDHFVAQLTDENGEFDTPGPVASQNWFEGWLRVMMGYGDSRQWIIALGAHGYDWAEGAREAEIIGFVDAMARAAHTNTSEIKVETPTYNPHFSYLESETPHTVWFLDATTFYNQLRAAREQGIGGIALMRLGLEDPGIWNALEIANAKNTAYAAFDPLAKIPSGSSIGEVGNGQFVTVDLSHSDGARRFALAKEGHLTSAYTELPGYMTLFREGAGTSHEVALTFDDGPDPEYTPKILDILKERGVKAAFFVVGHQAERHHQIISRILAEGHELGSHTYTHPNMGQITREQARLELNATQRLIEAITGRSTVLFRPPYNADAKPRNSRELMPLEIAQELNYVTVLENIDPEDWQKPGVDEIVRRVKQQRKEGDIILLHDAGGDRSQTVAALPKIIDYLQNRGDEIVSLSRLVGIPSDQLMPPIAPHASRWQRFVSNTGFGVYHQVMQAMIAFMVVATGLVVARTLVVIVLAAQHRQREKQHVPKAFAPPVSVIIAAYNEEKVIAATLNSVLKTHYTGAIEIVVIDDGSIDRTAEKVESISRVDSRVRLVRQVNQGKSRALRHGMSAASHDVFILLDADTHFQFNTISDLVSPLHDPKVGAVSGHAKVGNARNFLTRCQALEYVCGFNLDRRAYAMWNCITVVPGAVSAFHRSAVEAAGGLHDDTLAEDTDLTLALPRTGCRIEYAPRAVAWTEAPETIRNLVKQRSRWAFGTLQCLWKHRDLVLGFDHPALGWFSLPSVWFFQIILVAITPIVDVTLLASLLTGTTPQIWIYVLLFLLMDLLLAFLACGMERERWTHAFRMIPMRLFYRPLLSWVIWKAILRALRGALVGWSKVERTATVNVPVANTAS